MDFKLSFNVNNAIYLKNPEGTELGKRIIKESIDLINELGFENFTFRKLASEVGTTEATIYRYFENKHRLLLYITSWYWFYIDFLLDYTLQNIGKPAQKLKEIIRLLTHELPESTSGIDYNKKYLNSIVIAESSKVYLTKEVAEINEYEVFKPYKDLCAKIAAVIGDCNKKYPFAKSLSTTIIETAHQQQFFSAYLPRLTDATVKNRKDFTNNFLEDLVFKVIA
ncbi:MAG: TetR/AcrR family transcriptional regulator [Ferruginibacter sp.]